MDEIPFDISITGSLRLDKKSVTIIFNRAETSIDLTKIPRKRVALKEGQNLFDVVLQTAQLLVESSKVNRFTGAELYNEGLKTHPDLKRNSWAGHVIASAPNHPSYNHFATKKDYFRYLGDGCYKLESRYLDFDEESSEEDDNGIK